MSVRRAGGEVLWARDAEEANRIISGIVKDKGAEEVVKVKSIATDETKLNEHLEKVVSSEVEAAAEQVVPDVDRA